MDEFLRVADIGTASDLVVGTFNLTIFSNDAFHFVLEETLQKEIGHEDVQTFLFLL